MTTSDWVLVGRLAAASALLAAMPQHAIAGAFLNIIQSAGASSVSTAGESAIAEDAGTVYYNPAAMTLLDGDQVLVALPGVFMSRTAYGASATTLIGTPLQGSSGSRDEAFVPPSLFAVAQLSDRLSLGLGVFMPFGQSNSYSGDWVGRYQLQNIALKTLDIEPAAAWRLTNSLSIGAGLDVQYAHLTRTSAIDFGSLCVVDVGASCGAIGLSPQSADGVLTAREANWNTGFNLSLLYQPDESTHIGFNYRSSVSHGLSGAARFTVPAAALPLTVGGLFQNTRVQSNIRFPDYLAFGVSRKLDDRITLLFDFDWTGWNHVRRLAFDFANTAQPEESLTLDWSNSLRGAVGGVYRLNDDTELRAGISYDQTPVSGTYRSADLPDADEVMVSAGIRHQFSDTLSATFSYSHGSFAYAPVNLTVFGAGTLVAAFARSTNAVALDLSVKY